MKKKVKKEVKKEVKEHTRELDHNLTAWTYKLGEYVNVLILDSNVYVLEKELKTFRNMLKKIFLMKDGNMQEHYLKSILIFVLSYIKKSGRSVIFKEVDELLSKVEKEKDIKDYASLHTLSRLTLLDEKEKAKDESENR